MFHAAKICAVCLLALLVMGPMASAQVMGGVAQDGGICDVDAGTCAEDGGVDGGSDAGVPLACDGGLCDTTNGSCSSVGGPVNLAWLAVVAAAFAFLRRRNRAVEEARHD